MNSNNDLDKALALAGVCQAATLVQQVARQGQTDAEQFQAIIGSIVVTEPESVEQVFGQAHNLKLGLETLVGQLGNDPARKDAEITRYVASILGLERKLQKTNGTLDALGERIGHIQRQLQHMALFDTQMITNLAAVYSDVVSPVAPKIQVAGTPAMLKQSSNQHKVRALLLAGVRCAVLWRQLGGQRRQILFSRRRILASAETILRQLNTLH